MHWLGDNLTPWMVVTGSIFVLLMVYSWGEGIPFLTVLKRVPAALRLVVGTLLLVGLGNLIMWVPGLMTAIFAAQYVGDWGILFAWPGLMLGFWFLNLVHKPMLAAYRHISGNKD